MRDIQKFLNEIMNRLQLISQEKPELAEKIIKFATSPIELGLAEGMKEGFPDRWSPTGLRPWHPPFY